MVNTGYKLISLQQIPSTHEYALELVASGKASDRIIIVTDSQTSGRGRFRREWVSPVGNLYANFIYKCAERNPKISYAVAVAVAETLIEFGAETSIKWPNDVLIRNKKAAGILIEYAKDFILIGIGINIKSNPKLDKYETAKLGGKFSRDEVLTVLIKNMDFWLRRDFENVRGRWTDLAANMNGMTTYRGKSAQMCGINDRGALVLRIGQEYIMVYGDEISI